MKVFAKILNVILAMLLLLSTSGVTLHKHYCMGELENIAVFQKAKSCLEKLGIDKEGSCSMKCCEDVEEEFKVTNLNKVVSNINLIPQWQILAIFTYLSVDFDLLAIFKTNTSYLNYKPPLIDEDISVLIQSFLL